VVYVKLIEMGSTVLACPAFAHGASVVGPENIFLLAFASNRGIADLIPWFPPEQVIAVDDRDPLRFALSLLKALVRVRAERIDTAIDLEGMTRSSAVITWLTGAKNRIGFGTLGGAGPYRGRLFTHELAYSFQLHASRSFLALSQAMTVDPDDQPLLRAAVPEGLAPPRFAPEEAERRETAGTLWRAWGDAPPAGGDPVTSLPRPLVLLNPNPGDLLPLRRWPEERFVALGRRLLADHPGLRLAYTGTPAEQARCAELARATGPTHRVASVAGQTTLRGLVTLYDLADLLVSSDSGPCHFATLTSIHVVALFGPETPLLYGPLGPRARSLCAGLACSPCLTVLNHRESPCEQARCMEATPLEQVHAVVEEALAERAREAWGVQGSTAAGSTR
jgi:ADP-heptose:LPS heptosyltransferase